MRLAIYVREQPSFSETFIASQLDGLRPHLVISGIPFATTASQETFYPPQLTASIVSQLWARAVRKQCVSEVQRTAAEKVLTREKISILLANYGPEGVKFIATCKALNIPLVTHFHGFDGHMASVIEQHGRFYRALGEGGNCIIVPSNIMREKLELLGTPAESISVIRYGVDPDRFRARSDPPADPIFFSVGRFTDKKAPYLTLLAFKSVLDRFPAARLILAGDGELLETTKNLASCLGISEHVGFPGVLKPKGVAEHMCRVTAYVQHSITPANGPAAGDKEGTPVALLEAMMVGLPIIASRHAGIGEVIVHRQTGLLFEERDVAGMASAMISVAGNPSLACRLGESARIEAQEKYQERTYVSALQQYLEKTLSEWRTPNCVART